MENKINQQKDKIITACRILVNEGLTEEAILATIFLEEAARIQILAKIAGTPDAIPSELTDKITDQVLNEGSQKRVWDHYVAKLRHP